uniref:Uncharacterized protein n=1 Tax=Panagrolaimus sp. ES5 TaxID=591445 RepID=A0AC34FR01_9BILA
MPPAIAKYTYISITYRFIKKQTLQKINEKKLKTETKKGVQFDGFFLVFSIRWFQGGSCYGGFIASSEEIPQGSCLARALMEKSVDRNRKSFSGGGSEAGAVDEETRKALN